MVATVSASLTVGSLVGERSVLPREGHEGPPLRGTSPRHLNRAVATSFWRRSSRRVRAGIRRGAYRSEAPSPACLCWATIDLTHMPSTSDNYGYTARSVPHWEANPYGLVSRWDMEVFSASEFYRIARALERYFSGVGTVNDLKRIGNINVAESCAKLGLTLSMSQVKRLSKHLAERPAQEDAAAGKKFSEVTVELMKGLQDRIQDEMEERLFLYLPSDEAEFYNSSESFFSREAFAKWPNLLEDASESIKCVALSRYTASVFHLMRIMEFAVQKLGDKLGVHFTEEKNWQVILDQVNKKIKELDQTAKATRTLASVSANLYNVKLAWRNEVMHPKATYTKEETIRVLDSVKAFIEELATVA